MKKDIKELCVTEWGAVLEFKGWHFNGKTSDKMRMLAHVSDPNAIDSGQYIAPNEITLIARKK